jgi:hypothetical protein
LNTDIEAKIEEVIDQKIQNKEMFTAYDVSYDLQNNHQIKERHNNMKHYIHDVMSEHISNYYPYKKSIVPIGGKGSAFLYHPDSADINTYAPINDSNPPSQIAVTGGQATLVKDSSGSAFALVANSRNRVIIPKGSLSSIGLMAKGVAVVYSDADEEKVIITTKHFPKKSNWKILNKYIVDKSGNIMISENVIKKCGVDSDGEFLMEVKSDSIELSVED